MDKNVDLEGLKIRYGRIFVASADGKVAYFRKPTRKELSYALTLQNKPLEMTEMLLKGCFVGGDEEFITADEYMLGCGGLVEKMVEVKNVELGEL